MVFVVKVMHDQGCFPLWVKRDPDEVPANVDPHQMRLSPSLVGRLEAWAQWGDSWVNMADPHDSRSVGSEEDAAYDAEGRHLTERVSAELPQAEVWFWKDSPAR